MNDNVKAILCQAHYFLYPQTTIATEATTNSHILFAICMLSITRNTGPNTAQSKGTAFSS